MGTMLAKFGERYLAWSTTTDSPLSALMTLPELKHYMLEKYGISGILDLPGYLRRLDKVGVSSSAGDTREDLLKNNAAGPKGRPVHTEAEMIRLYDPAGKLPSLVTPRRLDVKRPLMLKSFHGLHDITAKVTCIHQVTDDGFVFAEAVVPDIQGTFPLLFRLDGTVLTKNFEGLELVYDRD